MWERISYRLRDWRIWFLAAALLLTYVYTICIWVRTYDSVGGDNIAFWTGFYSSWMQDVAFFSIVGLAVLIFTAPFRPDRAHFDQRIQAFYGTGAPHTLREYAKNQLTRYAGYSPVATRKFTVLEYSKDYSAYKVEVENSFDIVNLFKDVHYKDDPWVRIGPDSFIGCSAPDPVGEVQWISLGDIEQLTCPVAITLDGGFKQQIEFKIGPGERLQYQYRYWMWMRTEIDHQMQPQRVVEKFDFAIRSLMSEQGKIGIQPKGENNTSILNPGEVYRFPTARNATPEGAIFQFRFANPANLVEASENGN